MTLATLAVAAAFAAVHLFSPWLDFLDGVPRSRWLSLAGGVSVAYVFVHLLPELSVRTSQLWSAGEQHLYMIALAGVLAFYSLERLVRGAQQAGPRAAPTAMDPFWLHVGSFSIYNGLIGYLLVHREDGDSWGLAIYAVALGLHFLVNDRSLQQSHGADYQRLGRWVLAGAVLAGWIAGFTIAIHPAATAALFSFLAGGIVLNVLKEELPEYRESRIPAFIGGALGFSLLLLAI